MSSSGLVGGDINLRGISGCFLALASTDIYDLRTRQISYHRTYSLNSMMSVETSLSYLAVTSRVSAKLISLVSP